MNNRTLHPLGIIIFLLMIALCVSPNVHAADDANNDTLLNMLPSDCMFCLRINNFNGSLGKLDAYMAGASPIPMSLAMLVNMQLGAVIGDPMLTGIDQGGDFAVFAVPPQTDKMEPLVGILIPVTDYKAFVEGNPNCKEGEGGVTILSDPNSPIGGFALKQAVNGKYAIVVPDSEKATLSALAGSINFKSQTPLSQKITAVQAKAAATAPAWAYVNLAGLYDKYSKDALGMLDMAKHMTQQGQITGTPAEIMEFYFKVLPELFKKFAGEADSLTIALTPEPTILSLDLSLQARDGSELAKMLVANKNTGEYKMANYLDNDNAVNGLAKINIPSTKKMYDAFFEIIANATEESEFKEQFEKFKTTLDKTYDAMGDEVAFSFSYAGGMPPFKFQEVIEIKDAAVMKEYMRDGMGFANDMYKAIGIPVELKYEEGVSTYNKATIDIVSISMADSDDPNEMMIKKEFEKIYGDGGFKYYFAHSPEKFYMAMGPNGEKTLKTLIDQPASAATPTGDIKIAIDALQNTPYGDFVCSVNIIKLMKGFGEMMQSMGQSMSCRPDAEPVANIFGGLKDIPSQSCLVMGGTVSDGGTSLRIALPKQHLVEVVTMVMQIQQKMMKIQQEAMETQQKAMKAQQEMMQNQQPGMTPQLPGDADGMGSTSQQAPPAREVPQNPLQSWVGKPAPEMKMVDLDGKIHRVSRLKGKKVILDFWATWCPPCKKAIPDLIKLADSNGSDLVILGLSNEPADKLAPFVKEAKMNYPVITYNDKDVPAPYSKVTVIPTLFLIDSKGIIQDVLTGYHEPEELQSRLKKIK